MVELMLVILILSILSYLFRARYLYMVEKSKISVTKQNLATLQQQLTLFKINEGYYPADFDVLISYGYIKCVPELILPYHTRNRDVIISSSAYDGIEDYGKWYYNNVLGTVDIACTHTDDDGIKICNW